MTDDSLRKLVSEKGMGTLKDTEQEPCNKITSRERERRSMHIHAER